MPHYRTEVIKCNFLYIKEIFQKIIALKKKIGIQFKKTALMTMVSNKALSHSKEYGYFIDGKVEKQSNKGTILCFGTEEMYIFL